MRQTRVARRGGCRWFIVALALALLAGVLQAGADRAAAFVPLPEHEGHSTLGNVVA